MSKKYLTEYPLLMAEWDYEKNFGLSPEQLTHGSGLSVFWKCKTCGHSWQAKINNRTHGRNCPVCSNKVIIPGINDLATTHPNIAKEWDYKKNRDLTPNMVSHGCGKKVYWICPIGHSYKATILHRTSCNGTNCPVCNSGRQTSFAEQAIYYYIKKFHPDAISRYRNIFDNGMELDIYIPSINTAIEYDGIYWHKNKDEREATKYLICKKHNIRLLRIKEGEPLKTYSDIITADKTFFLSHPENRLEFSKFLMEFLEQLEMFFRPFIWHQLDIDIERDKFEILKYLQELTSKSLETEYPDIASEWNYSKNNMLTPNMFLPNSSESVWWKCSVCGHEWKTSIYHRTHGTNCPICYRKNNMSGGHSEAKIIYQYTINGDFIKEWPAISEVARALKINTSNISMCAQHKRPTAGGYRWEYKFKEKLPTLIKKTPNKTYFGKHVLQIDKSDNVIAEFPSISIAEKQTGINSTSISKVIHGQTKTAGGYFWKLK